MKHTFISIVSWWTDTAPVIGHQRDHSGWLNNLYTHHDHCRDGDKSGQNLWAFFSSTRMSTANAVYPCYVSISGHFFRWTATKETCFSCKTERRLIGHCKSGDGSMTTFRNVGWEEDLQACPGLHVHLTLHSAIFMWGFVKSKVCVPRPSSILELKRCERGVATT